MRLLVTGHCGFIGQNFVKLYHKENEIIGSFGEIHPIILSKFELPIISKLP